MRGERKPKEPDDKDVYRLIKWMYYMSQSSERARKSTKERNAARPEFASEEAVGLYEGKTKAYDTAIAGLIKALDLPELQEIIMMRV
jgi:hypothetical protein